ncbi:MAG: Ca2+:H+ antiporter [Frankiales bacterium]|nr:Ca2+:H+ antiporter [Frankiales bacterium]
MSSTYSRGDRIVVAGSLALTALAGVARYAGFGDVLAFVIAGLAIGVLASLVGRSVDQLADRLGAGATGVVQSALGNLPELFIALFALHAGLIGVVQAAVVGSVLANVLLVMGLAFFVGGVKHGAQRFDAPRAREIALLLLLSVAALAVPTLTSVMHTPASGHERPLSVIVAVVLLLVFAASVPGSLRRSNEGNHVEDLGEARWPFPVALGLLAASGVLAALVSDWFVHALEPAILSLGISQAFAGLVVVAIAGNAVENVIGIQLAARNQPDFALSLVLQSPLQIALVLAPALLLLAPAVGAAGFTLVLPPLLLVALVLAVLVTVFVVFDGESTWLEGLMMLGLYVVIAAAFWWG